MSANLNLASQPFRNRALPWTVAAVISVASLAALAFIISQSSRTNRQAETVERDVQSLRRQARSLQVRAEEIKEAMSPGQRQTLEAAHALVERKRFSWSRLFADLEAALPGSIRVTRISVRDILSRGGQTSADLELTVVGKTPADVTGMIADMDRAGIFEADLLAQNLQKGRGESGTEATLRVRYRPRQGVPVTARTNIASATAATSHGGTP